MDRCSRPSAKVELAWNVPTQNDYAKSSHDSSICNEDSSSVEIVIIDPSLTEFNGERVNDFGDKKVSRNSSRVIVYSEFCETITLPRRVDFNTLVVPSSPKSNPDDHDSRRVTCAINTTDVYSYSFINEFVSSFKLDLLIIPCIICGIGYGGRVSYSR